MSFRIRVDNDGALFNAARTERIVDDIGNQAEKSTAQYAEGEIQMRLAKVLKNPTGYYQSRITTNRVGEAHVVTDGTVVYGPWLEGTGSRNDETRFKGYFTFRLVAQKVEAKASSIAEDVADRNMWRF